MAHPDEAFFSDAPTLYRFEAAYRVSAAYYIMPLLQNLDKFCGLQRDGHISLEQISETARLIAAQYPYLRVTEVQLFFARIKSGRYGHFYGRIDPLFIMNALRAFAHERAEAIDHQRHLQERAQADAARARAVTYEHYQQLTSQTSE